MAAALLALLLASVSLGTGRAACAFDPTCEDDWSKFESHCYQFFDRKSSWTGAEDACQLLGAHLASVHSLDENDFLYQLIIKKTGYNTMTWLGGRNTHTPDNLKNREHHLFINHLREKKWGDYPESYSLRYVCAKKLTPV
uniref:C-type lectin domain-containing protein n=1 Tax=Knipowitschia caucasica TaxID=637954 RepID=A0AAV2L5D8_KNICA